MTEIASSAAVIISVILSHVASSSRRSKQINSINERLSRIETDLRWLKGDSKNGKEFR